LVLDCGLKLHCICFKSTLHNPEANMAINNNNSGRWISREITLAGKHAFWWFGGCIVPVCPYNTPMVHTQPTQNNNNRPCALFCF
jgi:hypothetical protein